MKKLLLIILTVIIILPGLLRGQEYKAKPGLKKYVGLWEYQKRGKKLSLIFKIDTFHVAVGEEGYEKTFVSDMLKGHHIYSENDVIRQNSLESGSISIEAYGYGVKNKAYHEDILRFTIYDEEIKHVFYGYLTLSSNKKKASYRLETGESIAVTYGDGQVFTAGNSRLSSFPMSGIMKKRKGAAD